MSLFNLSNGALFELIAPGVAGKSLSKLSSRQTSFHKIPILFGLSKKCQCKSIDSEDKFSHDN